MGRTVKGRRKGYEPRPVRRIELSEENQKKRAIAAVLFLIIGAALLVYCFVVFITPEKGWTIIEANSTENDSYDFVFQYYLGAEGGDTRAENRTVTALYNQSAEKVSRLFDEIRDFDGIVSIHTINGSPNTELEIDEVLYEVFSVFSRYNSRYLYAAPIYSRYENLFYCADDSMLSDFDPIINGEIREEYKNTSRYANDPAMIDLKLLGDNKIKLFVSDEYLSYAEKEGITNFIGLCWLKNAFEIDYIADTMIRNGFTHGTISSAGGFIRNFDTGSEYYALNVFDDTDEGIFLAASMNYRGERSIVSMRSFPINDSERRRYYVLQNGEIRTVYLDIFDGLPKSSVNTLISYSEEKSCGEVLLEIMDIYISDIFDQSKLSALTDKDIFSVYCVNNTVMYNDDGLTFSGLYKDNNKEYTLNMF